MKGRTRGGREIDLTPWQEEAVKTLLAGGTVIHGRAWGWTTVLATVEWLSQPRPEWPPSLDLGGEDYLRWHFKDETEGRWEHGAPAGGE